MKYIFEDSKLNELWEKLIKSNKQLIIATVITKDIANNWCFSFRNKIIRLLTPKNVKILTLEFNKRYCEEISRGSHDELGHLTIHGVMINDLINLINENSYYWWRCRWFDCITTSSPKSSL